jgi:hypothetical protein
VREIRTGGLLLDSESQAGLMKILENRETGIARN